MTLCDTGPLVAIIDRGDRHHARCTGVLATLPPEPLISTWPCWVEAMYLVGRTGGFSAQEQLWQLLEKNLVQLHQVESRGWHRMRGLMHRYRDIPMDIADASLVAAAEHLEQKKIFTLDSHFFAFRINDLESFEVIP